MFPYTTAAIPVEVLFHPKLTPAEKVIFIFLQHKEGEMCYKTNKEIASLAGVSELKVSLAIKKFRALRLVDAYYYHISPQENESEERELDEQKTSSKHKRAKRAVRINYKKL